MEGPLIFSTYMNAFTFMRERIQGSSHDLYQDGEFRHRKVFGFRNEWQSRDAADRSRRMKCPHCP